MLRVPKRARLRRALFLRLPLACSSAAVALAVASDHADGPAGAGTAANASAFGLAFWQLDWAGPVARALASAPRKPDFQLP